MFSPVALEIKSSFEDITSPPAKPAAKPAAKSAANPLKIKYKALVLVPYDQVHPYSSRPRTQTTSIASYVGTGGMPDDQLF